MFPWIVLNTWVHLYLRTSGHEDGETAATRVRMTLQEDEGARGRGTSNCSGPRTKGFHEELTLSNPGP